MCQTIERMMPFWDDQIVPWLKAGKTPMVVAHGNCLRGLVKQLMNMTEYELSKFEMPNAVPLVLEFDDDLNVTSHYFMIDE